MGQDVKEGIKSTSVFLVGLVIQGSDGVFLRLDAWAYRARGPRLQLVRADNAMILVTLGVFFKVSVPNGRLRNF
jgi:hypothetical protein